MDIINYENLRMFCYCNDRICTLPIKGIVLDFFGLGAQVMYDEHTSYGRELAAQGIILIIPYNNPWSWMNRQAVVYTDELVNVIIKNYELDHNIPIVSSGGSMGGLSALVYCAYAAHTPVRCVASCPVCDLPYHYTERSDLPRTLYSAFYFEPDLEAALKNASPIHLADKLPDIDYFIFHCDKDEAVNIHMHSDRLAELLKKSRRITYNIVHGRGHCDLTPEAWAQYSNDVTGAFEV